MHIYTEHTLTHLLSGHSLKVTVCECVCVSVCPSVHVRASLKVTSSEADHLSTLCIDCRIDIKNTWTCGQTTFIKCSTCLEALRTYKYHKQARQLPITSESHASILFRIYNHSFTQNPSRSILGQTERREKGKICYLALSTFSIQIIAAQYFSKKKKIHFPPLPLAARYL